MLDTKSMSAEPWDGESNRHDLWALPFLYASVGLFSATAVLMAALAIIGVVFNGLASIPSVLSLAFGGVAGACYGAATVARIRISKR